jgi:hypothetical protein
LKLAKILKEENQKSKKSIENNNEEFDYFIVCDNKDDLYLELVEKGIKSFNSCLYRYFSGNLISYLKQYAGKFNRDLDKTSEWSEHSPWWKIKEIYDGLKTYEDYSLEITEEQRKFLIEIIPDINMKLWFNTTDVFKESLKNDVIENKGFIPVTSIKYKSVESYGWLSNQYLTIHFIKESEILETIEINSKEELLNYQKPLIRLEEKTDKNNKSFINFILDDVLVKKYDKFNEVDFFMFIESLQLDIEKCRFKTNTKHSKEIFQKIRKTIVLKNMKEKYSSNDSTSEPVFF